VILSVAGLLHTTTLSDIVSVMSKLKMPFPAILMMTVALRFVPELVSRIRIVQRAQSLRGWTSDTKNPIKRIRLLAPLLIPVTRYVTRSVDVMTMSSANRAFGLGKVTAVQSFEFDTLDLVISIASGVLIVVGLVLTFTIDFGTL
jgi:energy-coupling factor transport system permease protein